VKNLSARCGDGGRGGRARRGRQRIVYERRAGRRRDRLYKDVKAPLSLPAGPERVATLHAARIDKKH
jgi:hypothetical protein